MRPDLIRTLSAALPTLRVVGLVYTGLGAIAAMGLVLAAAFIPTTPILQQVAEPARQAVTSFIQPSGDLITSFTVPPVPSISVAPVVAPRPVTFLAATTLDITIDESVVSEEEPAPVEPVQPAVRVQPLVVGDVAPVVEVEDQPLEDVQPEAVAEAPAPQAEIVEPAEPPAMQIAVAEEPRALPTPTLTAQQVKAQVEAQNHAVIEANKAATLQAKAEADAANHAAIEANKMAAAEANAPALADSGLTLPTQTGTSDKAVAEAANRAAIESARAAAAQAKADANAANAAAIAAAKAAKTSASTKH